MLTVPPTTKLWFAGGVDLRLVPAPTTPNAATWDRPAQPQSTSARCRQKVSGALTEE